MGSIEHLLAAWRDAQRALDELEADDPLRGEAEARVAEGRAAYQERIEAIDVARMRETLISA
jgi:hypothetical protein